MPRYYFHVRDEREAEDEEGEELPDLEAARAKAAIYAADLAAATLRETGKLCLSHFIDVANAAGETLLTVRYGDAVKVEG